MSFEMRHKQFYFNVFKEYITIVSKQLFIIKAIKYVTLCIHTTSKIYVCQSPPINVIQYLVDILYMWHSYAIVVELLSGV